MTFVVVQTILLAALAAAALRPIGPALFDGHPATGIAGRALLAAGVLVAVAAFASLGRAVHIAPQPLPGASLVDRGIYRYLRHPMYTAAVLVSIGLVLLQPQVTVLTAALAVIVFYLIKARYEEPLLLERYPDYAAYRARTRGVLLLRGR